MTVFLAVQLTHFDQGERKSFFSQWHSNVSDPMTADKVQKVAFQLLQASQSLY